MDEGFCTIEVIFDANQKPIDYRFLEVNTAFEKQTGLKDAKGKRIRELAPNLEEHWFEIYGKIALTGEAARFENPARELGRWYDVYAFRVGQPEEKKVAVIFNDITARKQQQDELELKVKERTQELSVSNEELIRSNKELEAFAYIASHDLQEPLRMVTSYVQLIQQSFKSGDFSETDDYIDTSINAVNRMKALINDLLDYSRIRSKPMDLKKNPLEQILQGAIRNLEVRIRESNAQITHDPLPTLKVDASQMNQLFQNLLSNALKFHSKERSSQIHISAKNGNDFWTVCVQDNGIGIEPKYHDRIFQIFQRLHSREKYEGTGIGLAICKLVAERHGGDLWVKSEPGKGSRFYFTIKNS